MAAQPDVTTQIKANKTAALGMIVGGLMIGIGMPLLFARLAIETYRTPWGFDVIWLICLVMMIVDFVVARIFWRRADAIDRAAQGLPPRS